MPGITLKNGLITYYGNPAGYTEKDSAIVDSGFKNEEFADWLTAHSLKPAWTDGVMERLVAGGQLDSSGETAAPLKNVRIWQLKPEVDVRMKFIGYEEMVEGFGEPNPADYRIAYDGQLGTNELRAIDDRCRANTPPGYNGHPLSMSDIVELYDAQGSECYYCDRTSFKQIDFTSGQTEDMGISMSQSF